MFVEEEILQPLRMWSLFIKSEKLEEILCHSLPLRMLAEDSWDLWTVLGNILFLYIMTDWEGRRKVRPCISHADVIDRDENPAIYKNLCKVSVSSFLAIISTLNTVHTETLLEHSLSYSRYTFVPLPLASASSMLWGQQGIHFSLHSYHSCTLCPFTAFSSNSLSQAKESSFGHLSVLAEAISFPGKQLSDFHSSLYIVNPSTEQFYAKLKETQWCTPLSQN